MEGILSLGKQTFLSLGLRNYRLYFIGQAFSVSGNWMQTVALGWLVLQMTGSGTLLGVLLAFRFTPMLFLGPFGGAIVDRFEKRSLLYVTQSLRGLFALVLSVLVFTGMTQLWMLYLLALLTGAVNAIDNPARQTFVHEMVGREHLRNAVTLNSTQSNLARVVGPAIAGVVIATVGIAACFLLNALSFLAVLVMLSLMRTDELHHEHRDARVPRGWLAVLPYLKTMPMLRSILIAMAVIGTLAYEFQVSLPLIAQGTFMGNAADYAALLAAMGAGSVAGGLFSASRRAVAANEFVLWALLFGVSLSATAVMPTLGLATIGMIFVGFFSICMTSTANTILQLESSADMRGRVMSLWSMAIFGSTLIGGPLIGFIGEFLGPRWALGVGGAAAVLAALFAGYSLLGRERIFAIPRWLDIRRLETNTGNTKL
ncbi:MAG: MFS transporter [Patescibacteria group bacterium]|nr:MFS transporter [Patescibacteria group bacterium]